MKEKSRMLIDEFLEAIPIEYRVMMNELAEYADTLGYVAKRTRTKHLSIDFSKNKVKRTIIKFEDHDNAITSREPGLRLKFYASKTYSDVFKDGIQRVIEAFDGRYTGCYGCGRCNAVLEGYSYEYPDGKKVFRCGNELIAIYNWNDKNIPEIKELLKTQDEFWINH